MTKREQLEALKNADAGLTFAIIQSNEVGPKIALRSVQAHVQKVKESLRKEIETETQEQPWRQS